MALTGHSDKKYITGFCKATSVNRNWSQLLAERWSHRAGYLGTLKPAETEIAVLLDGKLKVHRRGDGQLQKTNAVPGTIWLCPAGIHEDEIHLFGDIKESIHLYIPAKPLSDSVLEEFDVDPNSLQLRYEGGFQDELIEQIARAVVTEMESESPVSGLIIDALQTALAAHLVKNYSNLSPNKTKLVSKIGTLDKKRLARVRDFILSNIDHNITLKELANEACLSPYHVIRTFKATFGVTPHRYIIDLKVGFAKRMISNNSASFSQIAFMTGFSNQSHFSRVFKQLTGLTPSEYRNQL